MVMTAGDGTGDTGEQGAIVTRLAAIEDLAGMSILCTDKTGTQQQQHIIGNVTYNAI